jgi:hypothetical protein
MKPNTQQCSAEFSEAFDSHVGGCRRECECGRTHFDGYNQGITWEEGELEKLRELAATQPDKYIESDGSVGTMEINGVEIVWGCSCDLARKYEAFLVSHARQITAFLRGRSKRLREESEACAP